MPFLIQPFNQWNVWFACRRNMVPCISILFTVTNLAGNFLIYFANVCSHSAFLGYVDLFTMPCFCLLFIKTTSPKWGHGNVFIAKIPSSYSLSNRCGKATLSWPCYRIQRSGKHLICIIFQKISAIILFKNPLCWNHLIQNLYITKRLLHLALLIWWCDY